MPVKSGYVSHLSKRLRLIRCRPKQPEPSCAILFSMYSHVRTHALLRAGKSFFDSQKGKNFTASSGVPIYTFSHSRSSIFSANTRLNQGLEPGSGSGIPGLFIFQNSLFMPLSAATL